jgi:hypothetical protein
MYKHFVNPAPDARLCQAIGGKVFYGFLWLFMVFVTFYGKHGFGLLRTIFTIG